MEGDAVSLLFPFYQEWRDNHESRRNLLNETTILLEESREFCKTLHTIGLKKEFTINVKCDGGIRPES